MSVLQDTSPCRARSLTVLLLEDNGRETGMQGELVTLPSGTPRGVELEGAEIQCYFRSRRQRAFFDLARLEARTDKGFISIALQLLSFSL